jgi:uncharacterized protein
MTTATDLANYVRCAHRVFLDVNGDEAEKLPPSRFLEMLWEGGRAHEAEIIAGIGGLEVPAGSLAGRVEATIHLMEDGAPAIYHGVLQADDLVGEPDLLLRKDRYVSQFGAYAYVPVDVKNGNAWADSAQTKPKVPYAVQLSAYADLLMTAQGMYPPEGAIIDRDGTEQVYDLEAFRPEYERIREEHTAVLAGTLPTRPGWKNACQSCAWQKHCWKELRASDDLTTVDGLGESYRERLWQIGIRTASELAAADPASIVGVKGIGTARAKTWTLKARVQKSGRPLLLAQWSPPPVEFEVSYDIEDDTFDPFVYLHGFLVRNMSAPKFGDPAFTDRDFGTFEPVCATADDAEGAVWRSFLAKVAEFERRGNYAVYVFSHHERTTLRRLAKQYGGSSELDAFLRRFVDLERIAKRAVVFPTDSSTLKALARFVGFEWRDDDPGGSQSIAWWTDYLADPVANAPLRDRVLAYNEDDVRATFVLRDWLSRFSGTGGRRVAG